MNVEIVRVATSGGRVVDPARLAAAETVHRQLRPQLRPDYAVQMGEVFAGGAEMCVAVVGDRVAGVAVFRVYPNTNVGTRFYVDDLVTDGQQRSQGVGKALLVWLESEAASRGCPSVELESGTARAEAHRFYFREGFAITAFSFRKTIR